MDDNINIQLNEDNNKVSLIKENKLYRLQLTIPDKKKEEMELFNMKLKLNLSYKNLMKNVIFNIYYKTEALKVCLQCDEYKIKYIGNNLFNLCTPFLFKDEIINFKIINNSFSPKIKNIVSLQSCKNNTCLKPDKSDTKDGFSLKINSNNNDNEFLSFYINIFIGNRFTLKVKIESQIKLFNYDILLNYNGINGFVSNSLSCPIDIEDFELFIITNQNREFTYIIESDDITNNIKEIQGETNGTLFNLKKIKLKIKLKVKKVCKIQIISIVNGISKKIIINFKNERDCSNFGIRNIEDNIRIDNTNFFSFYLNEFNAKGIEKNKFKEFEKKIKNKNEFKFTGKNKYIELENINISLIKIPDKNIRNIIDFYNKIYELSLLMPIYISAINNEKFKKSSNENVKEIIKKNYFIMLEIYNNLKKQAINNQYLYSHNFFYLEINKFINAFSELEKNVHILEEKVNIKEEEEYEEKKKKTRKGKKRR